METKAIVLAAGKGTRMRSSIPKVLHKIFGVPLLGYVLNSLQDLTDEAFVIVGHQSELVEDFVNENYANTKCILQNPQLGTGHAVFQAYDELKGFKGEVIVVCGDTPLITKSTLKSFIDSHRRENVSLSVMSAIFENPSGYGRIIKNADNLFEKIVEEKDATPEQKQVKEINAGIYCLNWKDVCEAFSQLQNNNSQGEYYLTDIVSWAVKRNLSVQTWVLDNSNEIFGINSKAHLAQAVKMMNRRSIEKLLDEGVTVVDPETTYISEQTCIGEDTIIYPCTYISGKNIIGKNCSIGPFAHIRGEVEIADGVKIGNFVEVKKSIIKGNTNVSHLSYIGDSELGEGVNVGAGTITANYNPITKTKSKTVIKNGANTGSNTVLVAPVVLNEGARTGAGSVITKDVESNKLALTRAPLKIL